MRRAIASIGVGALMLAGTAGGALAQETDPARDNVPSRDGFRERCSAIGGIPIVLPGLVKLCLFPGGGGLLGDIDPF